jgi:hypothetical protein
MLLLVTIVVHGRDLLPIVPFGRALFFLMVELELIFSSSIVCKFVAMAMVMASFTTTQ